MSTLQALWISVFGLLGIFLRFFFDTLAYKKGFPTWAGTLTVNLLGSFLAGLLVNLSLPFSFKTGLLVGFCGGFTTFSSYSLQAVQLMQGGKQFVSIAYLLGSPILGFGTAYLGWNVGKLFRAY